MRRAYRAPALAAGAAALFVVLSAVRADERPRTAPAPVRPVLPPTAPTRVVPVVPVLPKQPPTSKIVEIRPGATVKRTCSSSVVRVSVCNGETCEHVLTAPCAPYGCDAKGEWCASSCSSDANCAEGSVCATTTGKCAWMPTRCIDNFAIKSPNGQVESCMPYRCLANACQQQCATNSDCAPGWSCEDGTACVKK